MELIKHPKTGEVGYFATSREKKLFTLLLMDFVVHQKKDIAHSEVSGVRV